MTAIDPDSTEAITLGLHDASPQHLVDAMADDVAVEMGWGRLIFGQTFADPAKLAEVLRHEGHGRRDICMYAREPHVLVSMAPAELFIDPSHTYRLRFTDEDATPGSYRIHRPLARTRRRSRGDQPRLCALRNGARTRRGVVGQQRRP